MELLLACELAASGDQTALKGTVIIMKTYSLLLSACVILASALPSGAGTPPIFQMRLAVPVTPGTQPPANSEKMKLEKLNPATGQTTVEMLYVSKQVLLDDTDLKDTRVETNRFGFPEIAITFSDKGRKHFAEVTRQNIDKRLAILIDRQVYSAPIIKAEIPGGTAVVAGGFSGQEAESLSHKINQALSRKPKSVSFEQLRANPESYDGKTVLVQGYSLEPMIGEFQLFAAEPDWHRQPPERGVRLELDRRQNWMRFQLKRCVVEGTFHVSHQDQGSLNQITRLELAPEPLHSDEKTGCRVFGLCVQTLRNAHLHRPSRSSTHWHVLP